MAKLIYSAIASADGYIEDAEGSFDWAAPGDELHSFLQRSWAAGVWTRAYDAKYQHTAGAPITSLSENEARERLRCAGTG